MLRVAESVFTQFPSSCGSTHWGGLREFVGLANELVGCADEQIEIDPNATRKTAKLATRLRAPLRFMGFSLSSWKFKKQTMRLFEIVGCSPVYPSHKGLKEDCKTQRSRASLRGFAGS